MEEKRDYSKECGIRCRQIRMSKGMSQQVLAEKMNVTPAAISKWEKEGISNIDYIMKLSDALGQDITADQFDQEGVIGEVGREILRILVKNEGFVDFSVLEKNMFGMKADRISNELFKLERIGAVIREQFQDYLKHDRDGVFITAKGVIAYKNMLDEKKNLLVEAVITMDERLADGATSFQDVVDSDPVTGILMRMNSQSSFRCDYLSYLYKNFYHPIINEDKSHWLTNPRIDGIMCGKSAYIDILRRMAQKATKSEIDEYIIEVMSEGPEEASFDNFEDEYGYNHVAAGLDEKDFEAVKFFCGVIESMPDLPNLSYTEKDWDRNSKNPEVKKAISEMKRWDKEYENCSLYDYKDVVQSLSDNEEAFFEFMDEDRMKRPNLWFKYDEIKNYIEENILPPASNYEEEIDEIIKEIWNANPETMEYYYSFPKLWEENGLAQLVRTRVGVPKMRETAKEEKDND